MPTHQVHVHLVRQYAHLAHGFAAAFNWINSTGCNIILYTFYSPLLCVPCSYISWSNTVGATHTRLIICNAHKEVLGLHRCVASSLAWNTMCIINIYISASTTSPPCSPIIIGLLKAFGQKHPVAALHWPMLCCPLLRVLCSYNN